MCHSISVVLLWAAIPAAALGCHSPSAPASSVSLGLIDPGGIPGSVSLIVPTTATVGVPASVRVTTWGSSTCTQPDTTIIRVTGLVADITVYDRYAPPGTVCTLDLRGFPRDLTVTFFSTGEATVNLHGRSATGPTTLTATLTVGS